MAIRIGAPGIRLYKMRLVLSLLFYSENCFYLCYYFDMKSVFYYSKQNAKVYMFFFLTEMVCQSLSSLRRLGCGRGRMENGRMFIFIAQVHCKLCHQNKKYRNPLSNQNNTLRYKYKKTTTTTTTTSNNNNNTYYYYYNNNNKYHNDDDDDEK